MRPKLNYEWAAGILEGEGCFTIFERKQSPVKRVSIGCQMTDLDIIENLQKVLGVENIYKQKKLDNRKQSWVLMIQNQKDVFDTLIRVMPYLGERRLEKAREIFDYLEPKIVV